MTSFQSILYDGCFRYRTIKSLNICTISWLHLIKIWYKLVWFCLKTEQFSTACQFLSNRFRDILILHFWLLHVGTQYWKNFKTFFFGFYYNFDLVVSFLKKNRSFPTSNVQIFTLKPKICVKIWPCFKVYFRPFCSYNPLKWLQLL